MKAGHLIIIAGGAIGGFFIGTQIPTSPDTDGGVDQGEVEKRSALGSQLGTSGRQLRDYSWAEFLALVESAQDGEDWIALLRASRQDPFRMRAIVRRWAERDAPACWAHILTLGDGVFPPEDLAEIVLQAWGRQDPEAAVATLAAMDLDERSYVYQRGNLGWIVVRAALGEDLERGMALMPLPFASFSFGIGSPEPWMLADPEKACRAIAALPDDCMFRLKGGQAALEWYRRDPAAALAWCQQAAPDIQEDAGMRISKELITAKDYDGARQLAEAIDSMRVRQRVSTPYVSHLAQIDPLEACAWVSENLEGAWLGGALRNILGRADFNAHPPETFVPFFDQMPEGYGKAGGARRLVQRWMQIDGLAAVTWWESLDPRSSRNVMGRGSGEVWAKQAESREWLKTAADTDFARSTLEHVVAGIKNPEEARKWAAGLPPERAAQVEAALERRANSAGGAE